MLKPTYHDLVDESQLYLAYPGVLFGFALESSSGAVVIVRLYDGASASGKVIGMLSLAATETNKYVQLDVPIGFNKLYVDIESGTCDVRVDVMDYQTRRLKPGLEGYGESQAT